MLDDLLGPVRQRVRPGAEPPAEGRRGLQQGHGDASLGEHHGGADPGDAAADDDGLGAAGTVRGRCGSAGTTVRGRIRSGAAREVREGERARRPRVGAGGGGASRRRVRTSEPQCCLIGCLNGPRTAVRPCGWRGFLRVTPRDPAGFLEESRHACAGAARTGAGGLRAGPAPTTAPPDPVTVCTNQLTYWAGEQLRGAHATSGSTTSTWA